MLRRVFLVLLASSMFFTTDVFRLTPGKDIGWPHLFSVIQWEIVNLPKKWIHLFGDTFPTREISRTDRLELLNDYLVLAHLIKKERDRLGGLRSSDTTPNNITATTREKAIASPEYLAELIGEAERLQSKAEAALESELTAVLSELGFSSRLKILFPPVDIRFEEPPTILVVSPRDRIVLQEVVLMEPDMKAIDRDFLENEMLEQYNLSAFVDDIGGIATYPAMVPGTETTRSITQTAAHEWLHHYLFFKPLGKNYYDSDIMPTLNETVADIAGREIGDIVFARMGGDLSIANSRYVAAEDRDPRFTQEMRKTRRKVDDLLANGMIEEAEQYMKERLWFFRLRGYSLRKLNQAFLAFRSRYAQSSVSVSPIGAQVEAIRASLPDIGIFIETVSQIGNQQDFLGLLEQLDIRVESGETEPTKSPS